MLLPTQQTNGAQIGIVNAHPDSPGCCIHETYRKRLTKFRTASDGPRKDEATIGSLVTAKNDISHGESVSPIFVFLWKIFTGNNSQ